MLTVTEALVSVCENGSLDDKYHYLTFIVLSCEYNEFNLIRRTTTLIAVNQTSSSDGICLRANLRNNPTMRRATNVALS